MASCSARAALSSPQRWPPQTGASWSAADAACSWASWRTAGTGEIVECGHFSTTHRSAQYVSYLVGSNLGFQLAWWIEGERARVRSLARKQA
jgi:hypothetical protein